MELFWNNKTNVFKWNMIMLFICFIDLSSYQPTNVSIPYQIIKQNTRYILKGCYKELFSICRKKILFYDIGLFYNILHYSFLYMF